MACASDDLNGPANGGKPERGATGGAWTRAFACTACATLFFTGLSHAGEKCPLPAGSAPALASRSAESRIAFIDAALAVERPRARKWRRAFTAGYGVLSAGQWFAARNATDGNDRGILLLGAWTSAAGILPLYLLPLTATRDAPRVDASATAPGDGCALLAAAEAALERGARSETLGAGRTAQIGNVVVNAAIALVMGAHYRRWRAAAASLGVGWAIGEAQIVTQPKALISSLARYRSGDLGATPVARRAPVVAPALLPHGAGIELVVAF